MYKAYYWLGRLVYWLMLPYRVTWLTTTNRVGVVLLDSAGRILLIQNWLGDGAWRLPGGGIKRGESPPVAAVRELAEEIGVELTPAGLSYLGSSRRGTWSGQWSAFRGRLARPTISLNRHELVAGEWFDLVDLADLPLDGSVKLALGWAGLWPVLSPTPRGPVARRS